MMTTTFSKSDVAVNISGEARKPPRGKRGEDMDTGMFINKIGMEHLESGRNCQDYGFALPHACCVCDGCSEGKHTEVGAKLFCHFMSNPREAMPDAFDRIVNFLGKEPQTLKDYCSFTILRLTEQKEKYLLTYCGDGYMILQDHDGNITFEELSDGEYPKYYVYNYIDRKYLKYYQSGVSFSQKTYSKKKYAKAGIASDGLRYILNADEKLKREFTDCLKSGKELKTKLFINRNHKIFKDDVTIVF